MFIEFTANATTDVMVGFTDNSSSRKLSDIAYTVTIGASANSMRSLIGFQNKTLVNERCDTLGKCLDNPGGLNNLWVSYDRAQQLIAYGKGFFNESPSATATWSLKGFDGYYWQNIEWFYFGSGSNEITYTNVAMHAK